VRRAAVALLVVARLAHGGEAERRLTQADVAYTYAVGSFAPEYTAPAPGSYRLPVIDDVADHPLLDERGEPATLYGLKRDRLALVAFVYTTCVEAAGCPVSMAVLHRVDRALAGDRDLARRATLVTISFDPERDVPARMATVRALHEPQTDWRFATTAGARELDPLLDDFGQQVAALRYTDGRPTGLFRHVLKVFLVDTKNRIRNVYSVGFLDPTLVLNDLRTLAAED
jgi:cytochrome oxidase Cu insertion factor (SCO1/SenC/PrrC family)